MRRNVILVPAFCLALCGASAAQTVSGSLDGQITDQGGAAVPKANVTAENVATGVERSTTTNDSGYYHIPFLPLGQYEISASATGENEDVC